MSPADSIEDGSMRSKFATHNSDSFLEFNLSNTASRSTIKQVDLSAVNLDEPKEKDNNSPADPQDKTLPDIPTESQCSTDDESDWEEMEGTNTETVYDDKGRVLVTDKLNEKQRALLIDNDDQKSNVTTSFAYTRIDEEEQAEKYHTIDRKTDFLFEAALNAKHRVKSPEDFLNEDQNDENFTIDNIYNEANDSTNQLATTRSLLNETQKFAYVGLMRLVVNDMATELMKLTLASQSLEKVNSRSSQKFLKRMNTNQNDFNQWSVEITNKIYEHLQLLPKEIQMIESLSKHGIIPEDLTNSLLKHTEVIDKPTQSQHVINHTERLQTTKDNKIEIDVTWTIVCDLFLLLLTQTGTYDARSRTLLYRFTQLLNIPGVELAQFEKRITETLQLQNTSDQKWEDGNLMQTRKDQSKKKRYMYVGMATIGGALILGLSGGLLAPVIGGGIAAGLSTIGISGTAGFLAGAGGTTLVTLGSTAIGARAGSKGMLKRTGEVKTFEFVPLHNNRRVNLIVTVSGWMSGKADDVRLPFSTVDPVMGDLYSLLWEPEMLRSTGQTMGILASEILTQSIQQVLGATILTALMGAVQLPMALSKLTYLVDNPWNVSVDRAWKAGLILADTLMAKNLGDRPITLLGFSLGSRVIYSCILELAKRGKFGIVENVFLFGSPVVINNDELILARSTVSGRFVNGYSKKDWILGYLYRATSGGLGRVAGLSPVTINNVGIENFDCTNLVEGHMGYRKAMPKLLKSLGFEVINEEFIEIDEPDADDAERQRKLVLEFDEVRQQMEKEYSKKNQPKGWNKWFKPKKKEWWQYYHESKGANNSRENVASGANTPRTSEADGELDLDQIMKRAAEMKLQADLKNSSTSLPTEEKVSTPEPAKETRAGDFEEYKAFGETDSKSIDQSSTAQRDEREQRTLNDDQERVSSERKNLSFSADDDEEEDEFNPKGPVTMSFG